MSDFLIEYKGDLSTEIIHTESEGNGPVNALDNDVRKALIQSYPEI